MACLMWQTGGTRGVAMSRKYQQSGVTDADLVQAIQSIRADTGCEVQVTWTQPWTSTGRIHICVKAYTDFGAKVGVARVDLVHDPLKGGTLVGATLLALHAVYGECWDKAHVGGSEGADRKRKRP